MRTFRMRSTRFRVVRARQGLLLYRAENVGVASWWYVGRCTTEAQIRTLARKNSRRTLDVKRSSAEDKSWQGIALRDMTKLEID